MCGPAGLLDLPKGFSYRVISAFGERMDDGYIVPDRADGMGCFALDHRRVALVRNHELQARHRETGPARGMNDAPLTAYDRNKNGEALPGVTTTVVYDLVSG